MTRSRVCYTPEGVVPKRLPRRTVRPPLRGSRCVEFAGSFDGRKSSILEELASTKKRGSRDDQHLSSTGSPRTRSSTGSEFLTMAEAGEAGPRNQGKFVRAFGFCEPRRAPVTLDRMGPLDQGRDLISGRSVSLRVCGIDRSHGCLWQRCRTARPTIQSAALERGSSRGGRAWRAGFSICRTRPAQSEPRAARSRSASELKRVPPTPGSCSDKR